MLYTSSDLHFNHENIIKYCDRSFCLTDFERESIQAIRERCPNDNRAVREFKISQESVDRMDDIIINSINAVVQPNDTFYILGDFCLARKDFSIVEGYRDRINCKHIHFILGNHDYFTDEEYLTVFETVDHYKEVNFNKTKFVMCHYAMVVWNNSFRGSIMLHGHSHSTLEEWKRRHMPGLPLFDVGFDEWRGPVSFEDLIHRANILKNKVEKIDYPDMP